MQLGELGIGSPPAWLRGNRKAPVGGLKDQVSQKLKRYGERGSHTCHRDYSYPVPDLVCGQSDLTQPEIHMAGLYLWG